MPGLLDALRESKLYQGMILNHLSPQKLIQSANLQENSPLEALRLKLKSQSSTKKKKCPQNIHLRLMKTRVTTVRATREVIERPGLEALESHPNLRPRQSRPKSRLDRETSAHHRLNTLPKRPCRITKSSRIKGQSKGRKLLRSSMTPNLRKVMTAIISLNSHKCTPSRVSPSSTLKALMNRPKKSREPAVKLETRTMMTSPKVMSASSWSRMMSKWLRRVTKKTSECLQYRRDRLVPNQGSSVVQVNRKRARGSPSRTKKSRREDNKWIISDRTKKTCKDKRTLTFCSIQSTQG